MDEDNVAFIVFVIVAIVVLGIGIWFGSVLGKDTLAREVCVTYGYDTGRYTQEGIECAFDFFAPVELVPVIGGNYDEAV